MWCLLATLNMKSNYPGLSRFLNILCNSGRTTIWPDLLEQINYEPQCINIHSISKTICQPFALRLLQTALSIPQICQLTNVMGKSYQCFRSMIHMHNIAIVKHVWEHFLNINTIINLQQMREEENLILYS